MADSQDVATPMLCPCGGAFCRSHVPDGAFYCLDCKRDVVEVLHEQIELANARIAAALGLLPEWELQAKGLKSPLQDETDAASHRAHAVGMQYERCARDLRAALGASPAPPKEGE